MVQALCDLGILCGMRRGRHTFTVAKSEAMILQRLRNDLSFDGSWQQRSTAEAVPPTERRRRG